eukprot:scaffold14269_cov14-Prasinocladus_malaysianus.AAC.1
MSPYQLAEGRFGELAEAMPVRHAKSLAGGWVGAWAPTPPPAVVVEAAKAAAAFVDVGVDVVAA